MKKLWTCILVIMIQLAAWACAAGMPEFSGGWDELSLTERGDSYIARKGGSHAILDIRGNVIYESDAAFYAGFTGFGEAGWAPLLVGDRFIALSSDGSLRLPGTFDYISAAGLSGMHACRQDGKWGIITPGGSILFDPVFDSVDLSADPDIFLVSRDGKYGYVTFTGDYLTEIRFETACPFRGEYALVQEGGKYGYIDRGGGYFIENTLHQAGEFNGGYAIVTPEAGKTGVINVAGDYILDAEYESVTRLPRLSAVMAQKDGESIAYNLYPEYVLEAGSPSAAHPFEKPFTAVSVGAEGDAVADANGRILLGPMDRIEIRADGVVEAYATQKDRQPLRLTIDDAGNTFPVETVPAGFDFEDYYPNEGEKVARPVTEPSLNKRASKKHPLPNVDGDEDIMPLFSALVQATYPESTRYSDEHTIEQTAFSASGGSYYYKRLVRGDADVIFTRDPDEYQLSLLENGGVEAVFTPIAMEAFVFMANADNPAEGLTLDEIRQIYAGSITRWDELGVSGPGRIIAYRRQRYSDTEKWFCAITGDEGTDAEAVDYTNLPGAIGYGERFCCADRLGKGIKLLSVDGVFPSEANIRSGDYPYAFTIYAVTRKGDDNPNTAAFLEWIQSDEGMTLIQSAGYVPIRAINDFDAILETAMEARSAAKRAEVQNVLMSQKYGKLYGYANAYGDAVIPARFRQAYQFDGDCAIVTDRFNYFGVIDRQGAYIIPPLYFDVSTNRDDGVVIMEHPSGGEHYFTIENGAAHRITGVSASLDMEKYMPNEGRLVATLDGEPALDKRVSNKHRLPRVDGATALFPVYSAFVQAVYPDDTRYEYVTDKNKTPLITCTRTNEAYDRLISGDADIIFVAEPSDAQVAAAAKAGVEFELTPFGKEAFVFIVNRDNPFESITVEQIRNIYSGKITEWDALGVPGLGKIIAYQRPENSGSQTALQKLMGDVPLMKPPKGVVAWDMGDIIDTIEYSNLPGAIGYTFRFFCSELADSDVKMLSVNGVAPTIENIRSGDYPITSTLYAVTRKGDDNPNTAAFLEWIQSDEGMELVEKSGYVPWYEPEIDLGSFDDPA